MPKELKPLCYPLWQLFPKERTRTPPHKPLDISMGGSQSADSEGPRQSPRAEPLAPFCGRVLAAAGRLEEAIPYLTESLRINPRRLSARQLLAKAIR